MTRGEDIAYRMEQVYVPLGLVERKKVPRRKQDVPPKQGSDLYREGGEPKREDREQERSPEKSELEQEVEVTQRFVHEQFLEQVLQQGQSPKSQGKRVAIIGEPGAGKTTLLQQIGRWVSKQFPESIVIWLSLADLQGDSLETYLERRWLQRVIREAGGAEAVHAHRENFGKQFKQGRVWLLLDGLDEMQVSGNPLSEIQRQLHEGGWLQQMRILLTCRLNLWDGNRNSLEQFDIYRTLEFAYPDQVEQFIGQWFAPRRKANLGQALCSALKESGRERIRDLVKNPLRLTLLCFNWYLQQGQLPDTQADLYQRFVDRIYEWKQEQFPTTLEQREQLNQALAKLSLAAIDDAEEQQQARFRLRQDFISRFLKESVCGGQETLFDLALKVGWLNKVGVDALDSAQDVYAFYHPTFEEYFAALGINDWHFLLNHIPKKIKSEKASYRIFEPQWRQVFLLWLGRKDKALKPKKEALIQALMTFKDGCGGFYSDSAFLLAAAGIAEYKDCAYANQVVSQLIQWKFGDFSWLKQYWIGLFASARVQARKDWATNALSSTDSQRTILALVRVLETTRDEDTGWSVVKSLGRINPSNETVIRGQVSVPEPTQAEDTRRSVAKILGTIGTGNETAIRALVRVLETTQAEDTRRSVAEILGRIGTGNETAIRALVRVLETTQDEYTRGIVAESLGRIGTGNETAIRALVRVLETTQDEDIPRNVIESLGRIGTGNETAIRALVRVLEATQDKFTCKSVAESLGRIGTGNEIAIRALVRVLEANQEDEDICRSVVEGLGTSDPDSETAIRALVRMLETTQDEDIRRSVAESLGRIGTGNEIAIRALVRVLEATQDKFTCKSVAESLGTIGTGNEIAIRALVRVLETTQDEYTRRSVAESLGRIDPGNEIAIRALVRVLETTRNKFIRGSVAESLGRIGTGNEIAIRALVRVLETTRSQLTRGSVVKSLGRIGTGNEIAIRALVKMLESPQNRSTQWIVAESLGTIDPGNEIAIRALVRVLETTRSKFNCKSIVEILSTIGPDNGTESRALARLIRIWQNKSARWSIIESLGKIGTGNEVAIRALVRVLKTTQDEFTREIVAKNLGKIDPGNEVAIQALVSRLKPSRYEYTCRRVAESLGTIGTGNEIAIRRLVKSLRCNLRSEEAYQLMMKCAETIPYKDFFQAFHSTRRFF